jgi:multiple sugar transport system permease protein
MATRLSTAPKGNETPRQLDRKAAWPRSRLTLERRETIEGYLFVAPAILGFLAFTIGPLVASGFLSLTQYDIITPAKWAGLKNFLGLARDPLFWQSLKVTTVYAVVSIPLGMLFSLALALLLNQHLHGISLFRTAFYLPSVISGVAVSVLWKFIFNPQFGIINLLLKYVGIAGPGWLESEYWALPSLIIMSLWGIGWSMLIYLSGLQSIPTELYEAAEIDGGGAWTKFRHITLPMLSPVIFFNLVTGIIWSFQTFSQAYIMTGGGPLNSTLFYVLYLYRNAFSYFKMGYAAALAWILFLIVLALALAVFRSSPMWVYYESEREQK